MIYLKRMLLNVCIKKCEKDQADLCVCAANRYDSLTQTIIKTGTYLKKEMLPDHIPFSKKTPSSLYL